MEQKLHVWIQGTINERRTIFQQLCNSPGDVRLLLRSGIRVLVIYIWLWEDAIEFCDEPLDDLLDLASDTPCFSLQLFHIRHED